MININKSLSGTHNGQAVYEYTLQNANGFSVSVLNLGGTITQIAVKDKHGTLKNVVLGYKNWEDYVGNGAYKGKTATALGVAHYANPDLLFHAGAAYDGDNGVMANAGVTIGIGSAPTAPSKPASPATVKVLEDKVASLEAQNKEIKEVLEKVLAANPQVAKKTTK